MKLWTRWWANWSVIASDVVRGTALFCLAVYRSTLSGLVGGVCRFEPSCACYAQQAFQTHSVAQAFGLTLRRLLRCRPLGPFGYDPVPQKDGI